MTISQVHLSADGPICSRLALGFWRASESCTNTADLANLISASIDVGITTFDHADIYGQYSCERLFGTVLARHPSFRGQIQLITKCGIRQISKDNRTTWVNYYDTSKTHIITALEGSLTKLETDHVDVLLLHRPDPLLDADEVAEALIALKNAGKILHVGVSNFSTDQFELLANRLHFPLVTNQVKFSVMQTKALCDGTFDQCQRLRISPMAWSPLGGARLFTDRSVAATQLRDTLGIIGKQLGASIEQVAFAWILKHPAKIIPVLGTSKIDRLRAAAEVEAFSLSREQWFEIWSVASQSPVL